MERKNNHALVKYAKDLRKNMTREERHLWYDFLKEYPIRFQRQKVIGRYIADFYCAKAGLVVELDGSQHYEDTGLLYDEERSEYLKQYDISVIRISNLEIWNNFNGACEKIHVSVEQLMRQRR